MEFFMNVVAERVAPDNALRKVGALIDWHCLAAALGPVRSCLGRAGGGCRCNHRGERTRGRGEDHAPGFSGMSPVPAPPPV